LSDAAPAAVPVVEARDVEKWYGPVPAVRGVSLALAEGTFLTVFGPNGAGKSTLLRMLCGAVRPTRGSVSIAGVDVAAPTAHGVRAWGCSRTRPFSTAG
jgi:ABC-type multidrug transport system ATPase subunit